MQLYRRNEDDRWSWQDDLAFVMKTGIGHKQMRVIARLQRSNVITGGNQKVGRLYVAVCDTLEVYKLQGRHKLTNQGSSATSSVSGST